MRWPRLPPNKSSGELCNAATCSVHKVQFASTWTRIISGNSPQLGCIPWRFDRADDSVAKSVTLRIEDDYAMSSKPESFTHQTPVGSQLSQASVMGDKSTEAKTRHAVLSNVDSHKMFKCAPDAMLLVDGEGQIADL